MDTEAVRSKLVSRTIFSHLLLVGTVGKTQSAWLTHRGRKQECLLPTVAIHRAGDQMPDCSPVAHAEIQVLK